MWIISSKKQKYKKGEKREKIEKANWDFSSSTDKCSALIEFAKDQASVTVSKVL